MTSVELTNLSLKIAIILYPHLDTLTVGLGLSPLIQNANNIEQIWGILQPYLKENDEFATNLNQLNFRGERETVIHLLSNAMKRLLPKLPAPDLENLTRIVDTVAETEISGSDTINPSITTSESTPRIRGFQPDISGDAPGISSVVRTIDNLNMQPEVSIKSRYLRAEINDGDHSQPLPIDKEFTLAFWVDIVAGDDLEIAVHFEDARVFSPGDAFARLQVVVSSQDFVIHTKTPQELRVPREGVSRNKARFDLEPKREGQGEVVALIYKDNNFLQGMILQINVGSGTSTFAKKPGTLGRPLEGIDALKSRDVLLFIKKVAEGFQFTLVGSVASQAFIPLTPEALNEKIIKARQALLDVVYLAQGPNGVFVQPTNKSIPSGVNLPFQFGLDIPLEIKDIAMKKLAEAGWLLYHGIFFSEGARADAHEMGEQLRILAIENTLKLQIVSEEFFMPWGLLYMAEYVDPDHVNPKLFLGMSHIIEHIPLQNRMQVHDHFISSKPNLCVSLNLDTRIDQTFRLHVIEEQRSFWDILAADQQVSLNVRETSEDFKNGLRQASEQILYFYGHAESRNLNEGAGSGSSSLSFSDNRSVSLDELHLSASTRLPFENQPLVFLNACESAELSPLFYGGFMPYFITKGARGLIGTESQVPAIFAAEWAKRMFSRFLFEEQPIGRLFLELRRDFYDRHNNPLGLLYALYCDGDTLVSPGLRVH